MRSFPDFLIAPPQRSRILARMAGANLPTRDELFAQLVGATVRWFDQHPELRDCSAESIINAVAKVGSWGVHLQNDGAVIMARYNADGTAEAAAVLTYRAEMALLRAKRLVRRIKAKSVFEHEHFRVRQDSRGEYVEHEEVMSPHRRGPLVGAYAWAETPARDLVIVQMDRAAIDEIREECSTEWREGDLDSLPWYPPKTAMHRLRREIGLPGDYLVQFDDDFKRHPEPSIATPAGQAVPAVAPQDDVDPFAGMRGESAQTSEAA